MEIHELSTLFHDDRQQDKLKHRRKPTKKESIKISTNPECYTDYTVQELARAIRKPNGLFITSLKMEKMARKKFPLNKTS